VGDSFSKKKRGKNEASLRCFQILASFFQKKEKRIAQSEILVMLNGMKKEGFWLINKPQGWTSFDVCAKLRKILNLKRVGHSGTLDPFATGLLLIATGKSTRLLPFVEKLSKTYRTEIILGKTSKTLDPESKIENIWTGTIPPTEKEVLTVLEKFQGKIQQTPPQFSALKIDGKKACDLARKGEFVSLKSREVEIFHIKIIKYNFPILALELEVSAGFYIRSFASDVGTMLCGGGMCQSLQRTKIGQLSLSNAEMLETLREAIDPQFILSLPQREIPTGRIQDFVAGRAFPFSGKEKEPTLILLGGKTVGVGEIQAGNLHPKIVL